MATSSPVANSQPVAAAVKKPLVPPDEQFWQRYSPHNEFPLSGVGSITIYFLIAVLIIAGIKFRLFDSDTAPLAVGAVEFDPSLVGGGGGDEKGATGGTGDKVPDVKVGDVVKPDANLPPLPPLTLPKEKLDVSKLTPDIAPPDKDDKGAVDYTAAVAALAGVEKSTQTLLLDSLRDKGKGGDGSGGGTGTGEGTGTGNSKGPGNRAPLSERQKRVLRWNMVFDTRSGEDYRQQLQSLGAILAIPDGPPEADGIQKNFLVIRELKKPVTPRSEDLKTIQRIFWVDHRPESVNNLAMALGLPVPAYFVAFFPAELEDKLARLEANFARNRGRGQAIKETRFRIVINGRSNKYEPMLVDQR